MNNYDIINFCAQDILNSYGINLEKTFIQHGNTSVFEHSLMVTECALSLAQKFNIKVDVRSLIRGSLLHDYFLYDWHVPCDNHRLHGFTHGKKAMENAIRDFNVNDIEKNMILCHMFPLTLRLPKYKESIILCIADKICATHEIINHNVFKLYVSKFFASYITIYFLFINSI